MKQIIQDLKSGETLLVELPVPQVRPGHILIKTHRSLVSLGTERMLVEFGKASLLNKVRQQPEKVKQVLDKMKTDGLQTTLEAVFRKLGEPLPLGYCNAGEVIAVGRGVSSFQVGDRVISNGHHAEVVCIPENLAAKIPEGVSYEEASFTVISAIALQGIRLIAPSFGETVVVTGLGLIGLIASQLLQANGCQVIGLDVEHSKIEIAKTWGIDAIQVGKDMNPVKTVLQKTAQVGADAVLITASTKSNQVMSQAANMSRKRGRIVLVGVVGLELKRSEFYEKELSFQVSCSYGPGRYDDAYELKGQDYPLPFVRWTEKRNFEAVLQAIASGQLDVKSLITQRVSLANYLKIYGNLSSSQAIASILEYDSQPEALQTASIKVSESIAGKGAGVLGIIGSGNFTKAVIAPTLKKLGAHIKYIASARGMSGTLTAKKFGIEYSTTDYQEILRDEEVDAVLISTRHNEHARQVIDALEAGKHVFVEKPLALTNDELEAIEKAYGQANSTLTVGFNRRFSPFAQDAKKQLGNAGNPINMSCTMNAGYIPPEVWVHDMQIGGGRIIGEACHLIDLMTFLCGSTVKSVVMNAIGTSPEENTDNASILLRYANGSQGAIHYFSNGSKAYSKERIEVYTQNRTIVIDNFRRSKYYGFKASGLRKRQDKGHYEQFRRFLAGIQSGGQATIPYAEIINTSRAAIAAVASLKQQKWMDVK